MSHFKELKKSVTSMDISKRLKSIDCHQQTLFYWRTYQGAKLRIQLGIKDASRDFIMLWGDRLPKKPDLRKMRTYSAYLSNDISELLRPYELKVLCHTHKKGKRSPYVCYVETDGVEDTDMPHVLEETEADAKGLMLKMLFNKINPQ